ncbi:MAG: hypothetical protein HN348_32350, partial [Proteobacteria bacterium]|nr:hypothetical protein [Pseudomonadota bacterium]
MITLLLAGLVQAGDFTTQADKHLRWKGYVETQLGTMVLPHRPEDDKLPFFNTNKVRLDLRAKPLPGFTANVNTIARLYQGTKTFQLDEMLPQKFHDDLALLAAFAPEYASYTFENEIYLNDLYLTAQEGSFRIRVGRQPIRFGSGYVWNPTDPFTTIDMLDPTYEKVGVNAVRAQVNLPFEGLLEAYVLPGENLTKVTMEHTGLAFRGRIAAGQWVFAATYAGFQDTAGFNPTATSMEESVVETRRHLGGLEVTGEILGVGLWAEGAYNSMAIPEGGWRSVTPIGEEWWVEVLGGATYTFPGGFVVMAEGLYNGRGIGDPYEYSLEHWFAYLEQDIRYLGRGYGAATLQLP